jgi:hypothetical protein
MKRFSESGWAVWAIAPIFILALLLSEAIPADRYPTREIVEGNSSRFISSADNTVVKSGSGYLAGIKISGGTLGTVTIYDNTTCTGAETTSVVDNVASTDISAGLVMPYGRWMSTGICVYTSAATNLVVFYK